MIYRPSTSLTESLRSLFKRRVNDSDFAVLGDKDGSGARIDVPGKPGFVYVRFLAGVDSNGNTIYSNPQIARSGNVAYPETPGFGVYIGYNRSGELQIMEAHGQSLTQAGINTTVLNPLNKQSKYVYPWQLTVGLALAVATNATASTLVMVKRFYHYVGNLLQAFDTPLEADKIDLSSYIPTTDQHCYAAVWIDTYTNAAVVTTSVAQATTTALDMTDLQELVVRAASSRPADGIPLKAFYLANNQSTITQSALDVDLRQFLDNPVAWGFPTTLTTLERVRPGYTLITGPYTTSGVGALTIESGGKVIIVHKSNTTNTAPTVNDDSGDGYSVGSLWFDTATGTLYVATGVTVGAAVWDAVGGGMSSFTVSADSGTPFDIEDADTLTFEGAGGIDVVTDDTTNTVIIDGSGIAGFAPADATYIVQVADGDLPNAQPLDALIDNSLLKVLADGVLDEAVAGTDYTSPAGAENLSNKTITASSLVATALSLIQGGFKAIITHSNSADRTYTLQNASGTLAFLSDIPAAPTGVTRVFNAYSTPGSTTHTIPAGCFRMEVTCVGGGGGGGSGRRGASATNRYGGGGGAAGAVTHKVFSATELGGPGTNITVFVGSGGSGGTSVSVDNTNGNNGNSGTDSRFGGTTAAAAYLSADGGGGGSGGTTTAGTGGTGTTTLAPTYQFYGSSGAGANFSVTPVALKGAWGPGGGGGGGGINSLNANTDGGAGATGSQSAFAIIAGGGGTGGSGGFGGNGANGTLDGSSPNWFGAGGGGGGGGGGGAGLKGGAGGLPGGGGGGGGGNLNGNASGSGTEGGGGAVIVVSYCYT